jgi:hypothetical protein
MRNQHGDDDDQEFDPEARPHPKPRERDPYDENEYDEDAHTMEKQAEEHDAQEAMEEEHERQEREEKEQKGGGMTQAEIFKQRRTAFADDDPNAIAFENVLLADIRSTKSRFCITEYWGEVYIFEDGSAISAQFAESQAVLPYSRLRIIALNPAEVNLMLADREHEREKEKGREAAGTGEFGIGDDCPTEHQSEDGTEEEPMEDIDGETGGEG